MPSRSEIVKAVAEHYSTIRKYATETDAHVYSAGWLLDIARCLYTLKTDDIIAKTEAGLWAIDAGLCPEPDVLMKAIELRKNPLKYKSDPSMNQWLASLGGPVKRFADVLEGALNA